MKVPVPEGPWAKVGVIAGVVSVIVAVVGLVIHSSAPQSSPPTRNSAGGRHPGPAGTGGTGNAAGWSVAYRGPFGITNLGINFDNNPPSEQGADIYYTGTLSSGDAATMDEWPQSATPTAAQCQAWVSSHPSSSTGTVTVGMQICLLTAQGRPVLLRVASINAGGFSGVQGQATVWQRGSPAPTASASLAASGGSRWSVAYQGPFGITNLGINFDDNPPSEQGADIYYTGTLSSGDAATMDEWPQSATPTAAQCQAWVTTHPSSSTGTVTVGMQICLLTAQGRPVLLRVASTDSSGSADLQGQATVWQQ